MPHVGNFPAPGYPKPLSIGSGAFVSQNDTYDWFIDSLTLRNRTALVSQFFNAPVFLPQGAVVTKLTFFGFRDDALSTIALQLQRRKIGEAEEVMGIVTADWTGGEGSGYDDTIDYAKIDNENYAYWLLLTVIPNDVVTDCIFRWATIHWT